MDFSHLAAGSVIYGAPAAPNFPVRLADEIFRRCVAVLDRRGRRPPFTVYDPCCGTGYLLTVLGFLHGPEIFSLTGSDTDSQALAVAADNLSLLSFEGLAVREARLAELFEQYRKPSHAASINHARALRGDYLAQTAHIRTALFRWDVLGPEPAPIAPPPDIVIADVPYGRLCQWTPESGVGTTDHFLRAIAPTVALDGVLGVVRARHTPLSIAGLDRAGRVRRGHREVMFFTRSMGNPAAAGPGTPPQE